MPKTPAEVLNEAPLQELITLLLRQLKRILEARQVDLEDGEIQHLAAQIVDRRASQESIQPLHDALADIVAESLERLRGWGLSFAQSLKADMADIPGWETTAEFLEIASEKSNAELRIAAASSLLVVLDDMSFAVYLLDVIAHDAGANDVDAVIARRTLSFASGVDFSASDWLNRITDWLRRN